MEIRKTYLGKLNNVFGVFCGFKPDDLVVEEEREVLYPKEGCLLQNKNTEEKLDNIWLQNGDTEDNYIEIEEE